MSQSDANRSEVKMTHGMMQSRAQSEAPGRVLRKNRAPLAISFSAALKSFLGYLTGTQKSELTIKNYRLDLLAFEEYLKRAFPHSVQNLALLRPSDIEDYRADLTRMGFKTNTKRRKFLTVSQFLSYLSRRNRISIEHRQKLPAPARVERIPRTLESDRFVTEIRKLPEATVLDVRNKILLWTLAETGCLVSEMARIKFSQWVPDPSKSGKEYVLKMGTGKSRLIPVSADLFALVGKFKRLDRTASAHLFSGFNRFGSLEGPISPRGIEMVVKHYGSILKTLTPSAPSVSLTPRMLRHSIAMHWFRQKVPRSEIQLRLGLRSSSAFKTYEAVLKAEEAARSKT